jgi:hypothetical protein
MKIIINECQLNYIIETFIKNNKLINDTIFVSYGTTEFNIDKVKPLTTDTSSRGYQIGAVRNKPFGGLWASPLTSNKSWGNWCDYNDFHVKSLSKHFLFKLDKNANIYVIDNINDLKKISTIVNHYGKRCIDPQLLAQNYDGIFATENAVRTLRELPLDTDMCDLYSWDVESLCVWNKNVIIPIEEDAFEYANVNNYAGEPITYLDDSNPWDYDSKKDRIELQKDNDFLKYANQNVNGDMSQFFKGEHPALLAQKHGNNKDTKKARKFNGTIKSGM